VDLRTEEAAGGVRGGRLTFASNVQATLTLTAVATTTSLPDVVIPAGAIPPDATISRVTASLLWRKQVDSSGLANAVNVAQEVQVRDDTPGTWTTAIDIVDNSLATQANGTEGGSVMVGDNDVSGEVDGEDTYNFQWLLADVDGNDLVLHDVQVLLSLDYE